jgi:hypothetical protein
MLVEQLVVLGDVPVVEIGNSQVKQDVEKEGEVEQIEIKPVFHHPRHNLNVPIDGKDPNRLNQKIQREQQTQVCQKFSLHIKKVKSFRGQKLFFKTSKK